MSFKASKMLGPAMAIAAAGFMAGTPSAADRHALAPRPPVVQEAEATTRKRRKDRRDAKRKKPLYGPVETKRAENVRSLSAFLRWRQRSQAQHRLGKEAPPDMRHDCYLHSHARKMRRFVYAMRGEEYPFAGNRNQRKFQPAA